MPAAGSGSLLYPTRARRRMRTQNDTKSAPKMQASNRCDVFSMRMASACTFGLWIAFMLSEHNAISAGGLGAI